MGIPHLSRRSFLTAVSAGTVAITAGLAAMTAVLGWFLVSASGRAQGVELTTAELVPQDSTVYVAFNTKLDSSEWIAAFDLVEKLGLEDPEDELIAAVEGEGGVKIAFTQIAGLVARRILSFVSEGDSVEAGERIGLIRFGSRVDVFLPAGTGPRILLGQRTIGGETIIAELGADPALTGTSQ